MKALWTIASNAYLEARHSRVLYIATLFAAVLILFSLFLGEVSLFQNEKVIKDMGLAAISILGVFVAIYLGVNSLYQDMEKRTIYTVMAKPVTRSEILFGKYLGMVWVLTSVVVMMTTYLYLVTAFVESKVDWALLPAVFLILTELWIVAAVAIFFSSFASPFLSGFFTFGVFVTGRLSRELADFGERSKNIFFKFFATGVQKAFDLEAFDLRSAVVHKLPVYAEDVWLPFAYALVLILLLLLLSNAFFMKRDFK
jgi:ABC-type transport system involved in multi-copper enzyme maturation permease subunit